MKILVVEDELALARHIRKALESAGHAVETRDTGPGALGALKAENFDLILLDVNLPGCSGLEVLAGLKVLPNRPVVIMLTARSEIRDRVAGLNAGADDYLTKPFAMEELLARVSAQRRRQQGGNAASLIETGDVQLDSRRRRVTHAGRHIDLSPREFDLLAILMQAPGRVFTRDELCERIWEKAHEYDTRTVEIYVMRLRRKLEGGPNAPVIETKRGVGYCLRLPA